MTGTQSPRAADRPGMRADWRTVRAIWPLLGVRGRGLARATGLGSLTLGASIALAATSAWLITRAAQMPPVMTLNVAAVGVRTFGVLRAVARYLERLATHNVALGGAAQLRANLYDALAQGRTERLARLRRGDLLARTGADVDDVGDLVIRGVVPALVAAVVGIGSVVFLALFSLPAAGILLVCLAVSALAVPALAQRADARAEAERVAARADVAAATDNLLNRAAELALTGGRERALAELDAADARARAAESRAAPSLAAAAALAVIATGAAALGALLVGVPALTAGELTYEQLAVIVLAPLAMFEATAPLPAAAAQLHRSAQAARRILALLDDNLDASPVREVLPAPGEVLPAPGLAARALEYGWPGGPPLAAPLDIDLPPGTSIAVVGPSGTGKTTLLLTLAGMLKPQAGTVVIDGVPTHALHGAERGQHVALTAEDAHIFATTVLENLRVARGDLTPAQALDLLEAAGLRSWVEALPRGLETPISGDTISGGERRRLLIARALASPAPILLLDEPAEHLPRDVASALVTDLLALTKTGRSVVVVTHHVSGLEAADHVLDLTPSPGKLSA